MVTIKCDNVQLLTALDAAEQYFNSELGADESVAEANWDGDTIEVRIKMHDPLDPRIDGTCRYEYITLADIRLNWTAADYYTIVYDEDGEERFLACFGC